MAWRIARGAVAGVVAHDDLALALLLVLAPWLAASVTPNAQAQLVAQVGALAGDQMRAAVAAIVSNASSCPSFGSLAGTPAWRCPSSASAVFSPLQAALDAVCSGVGRTHAESRGARGAGCAGACSRSVCRWRSCPC